jgi:hypothetical protein
MNRSRRSELYKWCTIQRFAATPDLGSTLRSPVQPRVDARSKIDTDLAPITNARASSSGIADAALKAIIAYL